MFSNEVQTKMLVGGERNCLRGVTEYRPRPRDSVNKRRVKGPELFGIARSVDQAESIAFMGLVRSIPRLSSYCIKKEKVVSAPSQKLLNRGQVSSALEKSAKKIIEPKDLRRWRQEILDTVNGGGSAEIHLTHEDLTPKVITSRGKYIGSLLVSKDSQYYRPLKTANELALSSFRHISRADSSDRRGVLVPRIDLCQSKEREEVMLIMEQVGQIIVADSIDVVLHPARGYEAIA